MSAPSGGQCVTQDPYRKPEAEESCRGKVRGDDGGLEIAQKREDRSAVGSVVGGAQHPQMPAAPDLHRIRPPRALAAAFDRTLLGAGGFSYGIGQGLQIITARACRGRTVRQTDDLPAAWSGQPLAVFRTQVVAVRLGVGGERAEDRGRVGIDVRQCRDSRAAARGARTATYRAHDVGRYRTLERAATTHHQLTPPCRGVTPGPTWLEATGLTCTAGEVTGQRQPVTKSPLGANPVNEGKRSGRVHVWKRAQAWPECSFCDMPSTGTAATISVSRRGLPCVSDGQSCTAPPDRAQAAPPRPPRPRYARARRPAPGTTLDQPLGLLP